MTDLARTFAGAVVRADPPIAAILSIRDVFSVIGARQNATNW
jgi:hypothetical protein